MGNCIVFQEKNVQVMKIDGKILEYKAPFKVHQILSQFSGHVISNSLQVIDNQHLQPDDNLLDEQIHYLLPKLPFQSLPKSSKKKVMFANDQVKKKANFANGQDELEDNSPKKEVIRVKIVISKKELQELLSSEGGLVKVDDIKSTTILDDGTTNGKGWKPLLDSIPEFH